MELLCSAGGGGWGKARSPRLPAQPCPSACAPAARTPPRAGRRVTLRGLVSGPAGGRQASRMLPLGMPPLRDAAWAKPSAPQLSLKRVGESGRPDPPGSPSGHSRNRDAQELRAGSLRADEGVGSTGLQSPSPRPQDRPAPPRPSPFSPGRTRARLPRRGERDREPRPSRIPHRRRGGEALAAGCVEGSRDPCAWQERWERTRRFELVPAGGWCPPGGAGSWPQPTWREGRDSAPLSPGRADSPTGTATARLSEPPP